MDSFGKALDGYSSEAVHNVVNALCRGEIEGQNVKWSPSAPELSQYVRAEQKRLDAINRKPAVEYQPIPRNHHFPTLEEWQEARREELRKRGFVLFKANVSQEAFVAGCNRKAWPVGATRALQTDEVWAPIGAPMPSTGSAILTARQEKAA